MTVFLPKALHLAEEVSRRLRGDRNNAQALARIGQEVLVGAGLAEAFHLGTFARELAQFSLPEQPEQSADFAQPSLRLYCDPKKAFHLDLYFWQGRDTAIHSHGFTGAGQVLAGRSLEVGYRFLPRETVALGFSLGHLQKRHVHLLGPGDCFQVGVGLGEVHRVYHLSSPTVSLVLRGTKPFEATRIFWKPGLSLDVAQMPGLQTPPLHKRLALEALLRTQFPFEAPDFSRLLQYATPLLAPTLIAHVAESSATLEEVRGFVRALSDRLGPWCEVLQFFAEEELRVAQLPIAASTSLDEKLFLCLLHSVGFGARLTTILRRWCPDQLPVPWMQARLRALAQRPNVNGKWCAFLDDCLEASATVAQRTLEYRHGIEPDDQVLLKRFQVAALFRPTVTLEPSSRRPTCEISSPAAQ